MQCKMVSYLRAETLCLEDVAFTFALVARFRKAGRGNAQKSSLLTIPVERSAVKHAEGTFVFLLISARREITRVGQP